MSQTGGWALNGSLASGCCLVYKWLRCLNFQIAPNNLFILCVLRLNFIPALFVNHQGSGGYPRCLLFLSCPSALIKDTEMSGGSKSIIIEICRLTQIVKFHQIFDSFSESSENPSTVSFISVLLNPVF